MQLNNGISWSHSSCSFALCFFSSMNNVFVTICNVVIFLVTLCQVSEAVTALFRAWCHAVRETVSSPSICRSFLLKRRWNTELTPQPAMATRDQDLCKQNLVIMSNQFVTLISVDVSTVPCVFFPQCGLPGSNLWEFCDFPAHNRKVMSQTESITKF